jgi:hypothetical protein
MEEWSGGVVERWWGEAPEQPKVCAKEWAWDGWASAGPRNGRTVWGAAYLVDVVDLVDLVDLVDVVDRVDLVELVALLSAK